MEGRASIAKTTESGGKRTSNASRPTADVMAKPAVRIESGPGEARSGVVTESVKSPWSSAAAESKSMAAPRRKGVLEHGFARIRCDTCAHEYLLAFSCKCRYFCSSCHDKRLAIWMPWLETTLLAPVPHRQVVRTIPKRLRAYCLHRRRLLGEIARVAARPVTAAMRMLTGERELAVGIVACLPTHGARANGRWSRRCSWR